MAERSSDAGGEALAAADVDLGTLALADADDQALRRSVSGRSRQVSEALDALGRGHPLDRNDAWR